jgi:anti-sigma factor RsiW
MVGSYVDDTLDEDRRKWFRRHLRECTRCREVALKQEPTLMFAAVRGQQAAPETTEACAVAVRSRIRQDRLQRRLARRRSWMAAAAAAVVVLSGGLAWRTMVGQEEAGDSAVRTGQGVNAGGAPPSVEVEMAGDDVRVYQFANDGDNDTAVYFIVDPSLEL